MTWTPPYTISTTNTSLSLCYSDWDIYDSNYTMSTASYDKSSPANITGQLPTNSDVNTKTNGWATVA